MDTQQTKQRLRASLEFQVLWRNLVLVLVIGVPFTLICGLLDGFAPHFWIFAGMVAAVMVLPTAIFCTVRTIAIFRKPEGYFFCRTTLRTLHSGPLRDTMFYTVLLEDPADGGKFFADTHAIFYTRGIMSPTIEEYTNSTVTVAYNRETEMVVVIG